MNKPKLITTACPLCGSKSNYRVLYPANFTQADLTAQTFSARRLPDKIHYRMVKCNQDNLVRSNPILPNQVITNLYQKSKFTYHPEIIHLQKTYLATLQEVLPLLKKSAYILEIGCGSGFMLSALRQKGYKNLFGVEPSQSAINHAHKNIKTKIKTAVFSAKLFKPATFDLICFFQTLDHIADPNEFLTDCYTLLKPGGYVISFHHNVTSLQAKIFKEKSPIIDIEHTHLYDPETTRKIFEKNKFTIIELYKPQNWVSLKHLFWLLPLPKKLKTAMLRLKFAFLQKQGIKLSLGNICVIGQKSNAH